jgi:hypothetical protein
VDLHVSGALPATGFVKQEQIDFDAFIGNRFGRYYASQGATRFSQIVNDVPVVSSLSGDIHASAPASPAA